MGLIKSLSSVIGGASSEVKKSLCGIYEISDPAKAASTDSFRSFQYFPESINESRSVPYASKEPLGGSHPIYQWVSPGERKISFKAVFSSDSPLTSNNEVANQDVGSMAVRAASAFSNFKKNPVTTLMAGGSPQKDSQYNVHIASALAWLKSKTYPTYSAKGRASPPPVLVLILQNSGINFGQQIAGYSDFNSVTCLMESISIDYQAFFPSGEPRYVEVSLSFVETIQVGSKWGYVDRSSMTDAWSKTYLNGKGEISKTQNTQALSLQQKATDGIKSAVVDVIKKNFGGLA